MNKMAKMKQQTVLLIVVIAVVIIGFGAAGLFTFSVADRDAINGNGDTTTEDGVDKSTFCSQNPNVDLDVRVRDMLASTKEYMNATLLLQDKETGAIQELDVTSGGTSDYTTFSGQLRCLNSEGYNVYVKGESPVNSNGVFEIAPEELLTGVVQHTFETSRFGHFMVKAYDEDERAKVTNSTGGTGYTSGNSIVFGNFTSTGTTSLDVSMDLEPVENNKAFGEMMYITVDSEDETNLNDWNEDQTTLVYNGQELSPAEGLSENERDSMVGAEQIYALPESVGIGEDGSEVSESSLELRMEPESDATSNDYDVRLKFIARGEVESTETDEVLENVGFQDNSASTPLYTAQTIDLVVN